MLRFIFTWLVFIVLLAQGAVALETHWGCQALSSDAFGGYFEGAVWQDLRLLLSFVMGIACVHTGEVLIKNGGPNASWLVSIEPIIIVHIFTRGFLIVTIIIIIKGATSSFSFRHYPHSMLALRKKPSLQLHLY
ncbi:unnamed protein product [Symbiodinium microadriaticum]|nr:unnamed protein product [Symbiodinium microadriaticum]